MAPPAQGKHGCLHLQPGCRSPEALRHLLVPETEGSSFPRWTSWDSVPRPYCHPPRTPRPSTWEIREQHEGSVAGEGLLVGELDRRSLSVRRMTPQLLPRLSPFLRRHTPPS